MHKFVCLKACTAYDPNFGKIRFFQAGSSLLVASPADAEAAPEHFEYAGEGFVKPNASGADEFCPEGPGEDPRYAFRTGGAALTPADSGEEPEELPDSSGGGHGEEAVAEADAAQGGRPRKRK